MLFERIFRELNGTGVLYLAVGGIAVNLHGFARATGDLDIMISFEPDNVKRFVAAAQKLGLQPRAPVPISDFEDPKKRNTWMTEKGMHAFTLVQPRNPLEQLDVVLSAGLDFDAAYARRETAVAGDVEIPLVGLDDLIALKQHAGRDRDLIDLKALKTIREIKR